MTPDFEVGEACERRRVRGDDRSTRCGRRGGDQQIVCSAGHALAANLDEQSRMSLGNRDVIGDHGNRGEYLLHECCPRGSLLRCPK